LTPQGKKDGSAICEAEGGGGGNILFNESKKERRLARLAFSSRGKEKEECRRLPGKIVQLIHRRKERGGSSYAGWLTEKKTKEG